MLTEPTLLKMFFMAIRKPCRWLSPSLLCWLLPHASTLPMSVSSIVPSLPQHTSRQNTGSEKCTSVGKHLKKFNTTSKYCIISNLRPILNTPKIHLNCQIHISGLILGISIQYTYSTSCACFSYQAPGWDINACPVAQEKMKFHLDK